MIKAPKKLEQTDVKRLFDCGETCQVEFKRARGGVPADFWPSYSAFANTEGGTIVLGVREVDGKREVEEIADVEKISAEIWNAANNSEKVSSNVLFNSSVFSLVDIGERSGMGLSSLYGVWEREKYADPTISQSYEPDRTKIVVEFESDFPEEEVAEKVAENRVEVAEKVAENLAATGKNLAISDSNDLDRDLDREVDDLEKKVMQLILEDSRVTYAKLAESCACAIPTIQRRLSLLQKRGLVRRVGPDRGGYWEVC